MSARTADRAGAAEASGAGGGGRRACAAAAPAGAPFDSTTHQTPPLGADEGYAVYVPLGGALAKLKGVGVPGRVPTPGVRGKVKGFTGSSRRRLMQKLGSLDRTQTYPPLFVGLTYPGSHWPDSPERWHEDLEVFWKRLCRRYPAPTFKLAMIWRLEAQKRGAPHFHLFIFGLPFLPAEWVGQAWAEITDGQAAHCSRVEKVRSWRGVMSYAAKYLAKRRDDDDDQGGGFTTSAGDELTEVGRHWGVKGRQHLPVTWVRYALALADFHAFRRQLARFIRSKGRSCKLRGTHGGLWCFIGWEDTIRLVGLLAPNAEMLYQNPTI